MDRYVTGAAIRDLREAKGMTQEELAARVHVSGKAVSKWETGRGFPDISLLEPLAKALDILECFDIEHPELGIVQICSILDLNKSNVHNIITTFEQKGYIEKNEKTGKFHGFETP